MGTLHYGIGGVSVQVEDSLLHHIKLLTVAKLRRDEPFLISWRNPAEIGGRHSIWIHREADLHFEFAGTEPDPTDQRLLDTLTTDSLKARGLELGHIGEVDDQTGQVRLADTANR